MENLDWVGMLSHHFVRARSLTAKVDYEDIYQDGCLGLVCAARRYDPSKGFKFRTFAEKRVVGAMQDGLRKMDRLSRPVREEFKQGRRWIGYVYIDHMPVELDADTRPIVEQQLTAPGGEDVLERIDDEKAIEGLRREILRLPKKERSVISAIHFEGLNQREVAVRMKVSDGYISQIYKRGMSRLSSRFNGGLKPKPRLKALLGWI